MNRVISCLMLLGFIAQQFVCCCAGASTSTVDQAPPRPVAVAAKTVKHCCSRHHAACGNSNKAADSSSEQPVHKDHHHHVCVGTHIFFRSVERFDVSQFVISLLLHLEATLPVELLQISSVNSSILTADDCQIRRAPLRPALGVYRI